EVNGSKVPLEFGLWINEKMPKVRYRASVAGLSVGVKEPNRPAFVAAPARGVLWGNEECLRVDASVDDPRWGRWDLDVHAEFRRGDVELNLQTQDVHVDQKRLESLPYVPSFVWKQIDVKGGQTRARAKVHFNFRRPPDLRYRAELDVKRAD